MWLPYGYGYSRPACPPGRAVLVNLPPAHYIEPGLLFFAHGNPVGGPSEGYRGVAASTFPFYASVRGPGAPLSQSATGLAGQLLYQPHIHGESFLP